MLDSIADLPHQLDRFWGTGILIKAQVLFFLFLLYLTGYYISKLLVNRNIWKWGLFIFFALPFLIPIYNSKDIIFIFPIALGMIKGLFLGNSSSNPLGAFEGITDFFLSIKQRRGQAELHRKHEEAEDILKRAKNYENQTRNEHQKQANTKEQFREEMRRERERQERDAKRKSQQSSSQSSNTNSDQQRNTNTAKSQKETDKDTRSPRNILGLSKEFTQAELKKARNAAIMRCHSDKWTDKPKAMQKVMEEETKKINWAYERLLVHSS